MDTHIYTSATVPLGTQGVFGAVSGCLMILLLGCLMILLLGCLMILLLFCLVLRGPHGPTPPYPRLAEIRRSPVFKHPDFSNDWYQKYRKWTPPNHPKSEISVKTQS